MIYLFGLLGELKGLLDFCAVISTFFLALAILLLWIFDEFERIGLYIKQCSIVVVILVLLSTITPNQKTVAMMVVIPAITESEAIQKDVPEIYNIAVNAIKEKISLESENRK